MISIWAFPSFRLVTLVLCLAGFSLLPVVADEKEGMPDLGQIEQTCLPTSTANLIVWFGLHGYPNLIAPGDSKANGYIRTVHRIMSATDANFDWGTRTETIVDGIKKYIKNAGYDCTVEFRGLDKAQFTPEWLKENDKPNTGFILLLAYCAYDRNTSTFTNAWDAGHAVTLVNAEPNMLLVHDPAHYGDEPGRKILSPTVLTKGLWVSREGNFPVAGLMLLSGSLLDTPPNAEVLLMGAVGITMQPPKDMIASASPASASGPATIVGSNGSPSSAPASPSAPATPAEHPSATKSWVEWAFNLVFGK